MRKILFNHYEIDTSGTIFNTKTNQILSPIIESNKKNLRFQLTINQGNRKKFYLHKLMALIFIPDYDESKDKIIFKDGDKQNCSLDNLLIEKDYYVLDDPLEEDKLFFEENDPYDIVKHFINSKYHALRFNDVFTYDDCVQYLVMYLYKKTPLYLKKFKDSYKYRTFAFLIFKDLLKSQIYKVIDSFSSIVKTEHNHIDLLDLSGSFIGVKEAVRLNYGGFSYDK